MGRVLRRAGRHTTTNACGVGYGARARTVRGRDDAGAVLVLALVFLVAVSLIVGALASWSSNDLNNTSQFKLARSLQNAVSNVTNVAIQSIRYTPLLSTTLNASPPAPCWGTSSSALASSGDNPAVAVWCSTDWTPTSTETRVVTLSACLSNVASAAACASNPVLQAVVTFDDYPSGVSAPTMGQCVVYCGTGMTVNSWVWSPVVPVVTSISTTSGLNTGPITGGTSVTISGTGFVNGTTVNFVEETADTPTSDNVVLSATSVVVVSATVITAVAPAVIVGTTYFVTVTTPGGTSAYVHGPSSADVFTYSPVVPAVTSISPVSGQTAGGTSVTINGTGFFSGATVNFVEESNGTPVSPSVVSPATYVTVVSAIAITAVAPAVIVGTTYFVTVTTPGPLTSAYGSAGVYTYVPLYPVVATIKLGTGSHLGGSSVTITGTGFFSGATVNFVEEAAGNPVSPAVTVPATSVVVVSATTITAVTPAVSVATTYYVTVTTPGPYASGYGPIFTFY